MTGGVSNEPLLPTMKAEDAVNDESLLAVETTMEDVEMTAGEQQEAK